MKLPSLLYTSQVYFCSHSSKMSGPLELEGVTSVVDCVKCVLIPVIKQDDLPLWIAENWMTHPLPRAQKLMIHPLSALVHPSQYFWSSPWGASFSSITGHEFRFPQFNVGPGCTSLTYDLRWLKKVSNTKILTGHYKLSWSLDARIKCELAVISLSIATVWPAKNTLS